jgi:hypothetical protein
MVGRGKINVPNQINSLIKNVLDKKHHIETVMWNFLKPNKGTRCWDK